MVKAWGSTTAKTEQNRSCSRVKWSIASTYENTGLFICKRFWLTCGRELCDFPMQFPSSALRRLQWKVRNTWTNIPHRLRRQTCITTSEHEIPQKQLVFFLCSAAQSSPTSFKTSDWLPPVPPFHGISQHNTKRRYFQRIFLTPRIWTYVPLLSVSIADSFTWATLWFIFFDSAWAWCCRDADMENTVE